MRLASGDIAKRLYEARIKRNMTMDELADKADLSQPSISKLERGINDPGAGTVERLALALRVDPCWLAYGTGEEPDWNGKSDDS